MKSTIMVVDDDKSNLAAAKILLESQYEVSLVNSGIKALKLLELFVPDLILLDLKMPDMDGFEVLDVIKGSDRFKHIPVIILTADKSDETERDCFVHGAVDYIGKPFKAAVMLERVRRTLELESLRNHLEQQVKEKTNELETVILQSIVAIANMIDARGEFTKGHSIRVAEYSMLIAKEMGWKEEDLNRLYHAALLHDIGNIGIPDSVLNKMGHLTTKEMEVIRSHAKIGGDILQDITTMSNVRDGAKYHHERYDGKGYPHGLKGEEIPIYARIISVADAYEAMLNDRIYRNKLSDEEVMQELYHERGQQFDPNVIDALIRLINRFGNLRELCNNKGEQTDDRSRLVQRIFEKQSETNRSEASFDWLTGLYNRSFSEREIIRMLREDNGAFLLIDLDNFKMVNDFYGHAAGDAVLQSVAEILKDNISSRDIASRVGGDEFSVYYHGISQKEEIEKLVKKILADFEERKKKEPLLTECSLSIGISFAGQNESCYIDVFKKADRALYCVKQNGKNGYEIYNENNQDMTESFSDGFSELQRFVQLLENEKTKTGVYEVGYREINRTLELVARFVERNEQALQLVLFTLASVNGEADFEKQQEAMAVLDKVIHNSLRRVDISTRYSSLQHMVVLVDTDEEGIEIVARRITREFQKSKSFCEFAITYDYVGINVEKEKNEKN